MSNITLRYSFHIDSREGHNFSLSDGNISSRKKDVIHVRTLCHEYYLLFANETFKLVLSRWLIFKFFDWLVTYGVKKFLRSLNLLRWKRRTELFNPKHCHILIVGWLYLWQFVDFIVGVDGLQHYIKLTNQYLILIPCFKHPSLWYACLSL